MSPPFDFDRPVERRGTASLKWDRYPGNVLPLWVADMDFRAAPPVVAAMADLAALGVYGYDLLPASLVEAVQRFLLIRYGWEIREDWVVALPGLVPGLTHATLAYARRDEGVMTIAPVYPPFLEVPVAHGRRLQPVIAPLEHDTWRLPLEDMEAAVTPETKLLLFCHPHNPLGRVWRAEEVAAVVEFCRRHGLVLCSDEVHCDLVLDSLSHLPAALAHPEAESVTVTLMSPSKAFNLPGLNFAYAIIPDPELRRRFRAVADGLLPLPGCFAVAGAEAAYRDGGPWLAALIEYLRANRDRVEAWAGALPAVTMTHVEATYLAWLDVRGLGLPDPAAACVRAGVALSDGAFFGDPGCLRLNFGCPRVVLEDALSRLEAVFAAGALRAG